MTPKHIKTLMKPTESKSELPKGVRGSGKRFTAYLYEFDYQHYLGTFDTPEEAGKQYQLARAALVTKRLTEYRKQKNSDKNIIEKLLNSVTNSLQTQLT